MIITGDGRIIIQDKMIRVLFFCSFGIVLLFSCNSNLELNSNCIGLSKFETVASLYGVIGNVQPKIKFDLNGQGRIGGIQTFEVFKWECINDSLITILPTNVDDELEHGTYKMLYYDDLDNNELTFVKLELLSDEENDKATNLNKQQNRLDTLIGGDKILWLGENEIILVRVKDKEATKHNTR